MENRTSVAEALSDRVLEAVQLKPYPSYKLRTGPVRKES
jgi:hypothetical protein